MKIIIGIVGAALLAAAAGAAATTLVEVVVKDAADFESFRAAEDARCIFVGGIAYSAVADAEVSAFQPGGRSWAGVAHAGDGEVFLVLPAGAPYQGKARDTGTLGGGNQCFVLAEDEARLLPPVFAHNVVGGPPLTGSSGPRRLPARDPMEANVVERVSRDNLITVDTRLQDFWSRFAFYSGNDDATDYLEAEFRKVPRLDVDRQYFTAESWGGATKTVANVVAVMPGVKHPGQEIVVGAHFDSATYGSFGDPAAHAPGADDDASGTAAVVECARVLSAYAFDRTVVFVAFNAEEVGLFGSEAYADAAAERGDDIRAMVNLDMVAYDNDGVLDADVITNGESYDLAELMVEKAADYTPIEMRVVEMNVPYSDHYYFWENGYRAIWQYEGWNDETPYIHTDQDTVATLNPVFFEEMTKAFVATVFDLAGYNTSPLIGITAPAGGEYADADFRIAWWDVDGDDAGKDATISLYYNAEKKTEGGTYIAGGIRQNDQGNRGSYDWDTSAVPPGRYYVYGVIEDGAHPPYAAVSEGALYVMHGSRVVVYPNPVRKEGGAAQVIFDGLLVGDRITVYDLAGRQVFEARADARRMRWNAAAFAAGVYIYRVESDVTAEPATGKLAILK